MVVYGNVFKVNVNGILLKWICKCDKMICILNKQWPTQCLLLKFNIARFNTNS